MAHRPPPTVIQINAILLHAHAHTLASTHPYLSDCVDQPNNYSMLAWCIMRTRSVIFYVRGKVHFRRAEHIIRITHIQRTPFANGWAAFITMWAWDRYTSQKNHRMPPSMRSLRGKEFCWLCRVPGRYTHIHIHVHIFVYEERARRWYRYDMTAVKVCKLPVTVPQHSLNYRANGISSPVRLGKMQEQVAAPPSRELRRSIHPVHTAQHSAEIIQ